MNLKSDLRSLIPLMFARKAKKVNRRLLADAELPGLRVFATTVIRESQNPDMTGFLLEIDWQTNQVLRRIPIPLDTQHPFWNARGGNRGGRGVVAYQGVLYVASSMSVLLFDRELHQIGELTHPYLAGLHEMYIDASGIWLTSTVHDLIVKLDFDGKILDEWWGSESELLQNRFGFSGRKMNLQLDFPKENFSDAYEQYCAEERLHANTVWVHDEKVYVLACRKLALIKIRPEPEQIILADQRLKSPHNGIVTPDGRIILNDTQHQAIRSYDLASGRPLRTLMTSLYLRPHSHQFTTAGWQRGLAHVSGSIFLVGTSPATVFEVDIDRGLIGQVCAIDSDVRHCIHGLTVTKDF